MNYISVKLLPKKKKISQAKEAGRRNGISALRNVKLHGVSEELEKVGRKRRARVRNVQG